MSSGRIGGVKMPLERRLALGRRVAEARQAKGWRRVDLARACGRCELSVKKIEEALVEPSVMTLETLARALGVTTDWLLDPAEAAAEGRAA